MSQSHIDPQPPGLTEVASRVREDLGLLRTALSRERTEIEERIRTQVHAHPVGTLLAAFGCGYLLGGGLSRLTLPLLGLSFRVFASDIVGRALSEMDVSGETIPRTL